MPQTQKSLGSSIQIGTCQTFILIFVFRYFSDAGAGGEKVLWSAVSAIQRAKGQLGKKDSNIRIHIYSGSQMNPEDILEQKVRLRFGINIHSDNLEFVTIDKDLHNALDPKNYPSFTMVW